ncbi:hypothetical protein Pan258_27410 [Symmachiella dynata]|nr:hypothetical protein Pan258_27410 [Symmachiella dynata]
MTRSKFQRRGLKLIELLVVIAMIADSWPRGLRQRSV